MKIVIRITARDSAKAWGILVRHSPGMALRNREFIVSEEAVRALEQAGIKFRVVSREGIHSGETTGERV
jgi:hypothetical protein